MSEIFLDRKFSVSKLCGATDKFSKSCRKIEKQLALENAQKMQTQTKKKKPKDLGLESLLWEEQVEDETSADEVLVEQKE